MNEPETSADLTIRLIRLHESVRLPVRASSGAAGYDVHAFVQEAVVIRPGERAAIPTGMILEIPDGIMVSVRPRSGLAIKNGITMINSPGTIDSDFRGEVKILLVNLGDEDFTVNSGDRIAQFVVEKFFTAEWKPSASLTESGRGEGGFGSTGKS